MNNSEPCRVCGGDGRIANAFGGSSATCPACHGTGRREETTGFRDVTKTKPSHYKQAASAGAAKTKEPTTVDGTRLAIDIRKSGLAAETKAKLVAEIIDHEETHGRCTETFLKKIRKQLR